MVTFLCNKIGRDKGLESFKAEGVSLQYRILKGQELCDALRLKLFEEASEVQEALCAQDVIVELADVLEVVDGLCKAYGISLQEVVRAKEKKYKERGGFEKGFFIEVLEMDENNPKINHFRATPDKYPEL